MKGPTFRELKFLSRGPCCRDVLSDSVTIYITLVNLDACEVRGVQLVFDFCLQMFKCSFTHEVTNIFLRICAYVY